MRSQSPSAVKPLLALIAAGLAASPLATAHAQSDPFALPKGLTQESVASIPSGPIVSEIVVDGQLRRRMVTLEGSGDKLTIDAEDARAAGLPVEEGAKGQIPLASLTLYEWRFDSLRQQLKVALFRKNDGANFRDLSARSLAEGVRSTPLTTLRLDYDVTATATPKVASFGGFFGAFAVRGNAALGTTARVISNPPVGASPVVRLDSTLQIAFEKRGLVATAGDFISAGSQSQRPVRMGGLQIATDFELRPDIVSLPLPAFSGTVSVPTTIDLVGANEKLRIEGIEPGEFTVRNIPTAPGRGEMTAILRDSLGREVLQHAKFYVSRDLLSPGRSAYAVNAGFVRRRYGDRSTDYGALAASAFFRRGLSPRLTVEGSGEWTPGTANVGARADFVIGAIAKATVEGRVSRDRDAGNGFLANLGIESMGPRFGIAAGATLPGATYRDVATRLGDLAPPKQMFVNAFYRLGSNSQVQLAAVRRESRADARTGRAAERTDSIAASLQMPITKRLRFFGSADYRETRVRSGFGIAGGLALELGGARRVNAYAAHNAGRSSASASYSKDDIEVGDIGYRGSATVSDSDYSLNAQMSLRASFARIVAEAEHVSGRVAGRVTARGTLMLAGGSIYARNSSGSSYALVRAGDVEGIPVTLDNRFVGKTGKSGRLLVENIPAQATVKIDVDADQLPSEAVVREATHHIRVPRRAVALVKIDAVRFRPVTRTLVDAAGKPLAAGLPVRSLPGDGVTLTGFDGLVELNGAAKYDRLMVGAPGSGCVVDLAGVDLEQDGSASLVCRPFNIAGEAPPSPEVATLDRKGKPKRVARRDFAGAAARSGLAPNGP